ncbi:short-subunit dehydrogenase [Granulicella aggregans]|uniref:Short-subunit dehydrogenase n=1 Tax=Granulicella aggregans TaxID=474949 RepID=A0A7W8E5W3_9BACT|nr:short-subunit dehydrogenase [Granulicella aggregans]
MNSKPSSSEVFSLKDRVVVLTGAASGIGAALVDQLAMEGAHLALIDKDHVSLETVAEAARQSGASIRTYNIDLADESAITTLPDAIASDLGTASVLFNIAGMALAGTFEQVSSQRFHHLFAVNFFSMAAMTRSFLPHLRQHRSAQIVNMSSVFGIIGSAGQVAYSASKFAVRGFSESLRAELESADIGVTVIHPGGVKTNIVLSALVEAGLSEQEIRPVRGPAEKPLTMEARYAAAIIIRGVKRRKQRILVGEDARLVARVQRRYPLSYSRILAEQA